MPIVELPNGQEAEFPDGMSHEEIKAAIYRKFPEYAPKQEAAPAAPAEEPGLLRQALNTVGGVLGDVASTVMDSLDVTRLPEKARQLRDAPTKVHPNDPDGVMGAVVRDQQRPGMTVRERDPAPDGIGDFTWARARAQERTDPLDPRLAAIKPGDELARAQNIASERANAGKASYQRIMARAREDNARDARQAKLEAERYSLENLAGNATDNVRNVTAGALKIGPTAVKGAADIGRLFTGDKVGKDTSETMQRGMKAIDEVVASAQFNDQQGGFQQLMADESAGVGDLFAYLIDNPAIMLDAGITTVGSMALPAGAAKGAVMGARALGLGSKAAGTVATVASTATVAAQNAGDTFTSPELANASIEDRNKAAMVSGAISILTGIAFKGGAEGEIARRLAGDLRAGRTTLEAVKGYIKATLNEGAQEAGEEAGNILGQSVATLEAPGWNNSVKQLAFAGTLGAIFGAGTHSATGGPAAPDDGSAAAEQARTDALNRWNTNGLTTSSAAPGGRREPTMGMPAGAVDAPERAEPSLDDIAGATTLDGAIAAAQAVASAPVSSPHATAAEIDALEEAAFLEGANETLPPTQGIDPAGSGRAVVRDEALGAPGLEGDGRVSGQRPGTAAEDAAPGGDGGLVGGAVTDVQPSLTSLTASLTGKPDGSPAAADLPPGGKTAPQADVAGKSDDGADWFDFPPESRTLGIPRAEMPQIKAEHRGAMTQFLKARGITHQEIEVDANQLKPTQREFSMSKVQQAVDYKGGNRAILVSSDGHVLDGHHQWLAAASAGEPIRAIQLDAPIRQLLETVREFPSAGVDTSSAAPATNGFVVGQKWKNSSGTGSYTIESVSTDGKLGQARFPGESKTYSVHYDAETANGWAAEDPQPIAQRPGQELLDRRDQQNQRQADAVAAAAQSLANRKNTGGQRARDRVAKENPLLAFLASHGLQLDERSDTGGQAGRAGQVMVPGYGSLYRRSGKRLDELAQLALEAGFLTQEDIDNPADTGGTRKLADLIQRAVHGREAIAPAGLMDAAMPSVDERLLEEAARLGIDTTGKSTDAIYDEVAAAYRANEDRQEATGATSIDEQEQIEAIANRASERAAQVAADMLRDGDIPLDGGKPFDNLTEEEIDAVFGIQSQGARGAGRADEENAAEATSEGAARAGPESEGEPLLSGYTGAEVLERERQAAERAKAKKAEADRLEAERKKKEERALIDATVDDFQLGQDAETQITGQRSIFDAPAAPSLFDAPAAAPAENLEKLSEKRETLQDLLADNPDRKGADQMRAELERINGILGEQQADPKKAPRLERMIAPTDAPPYMQPLYDMRYEWETITKYATPTKKGAFKSRLRALAKTIPFSDEKAVSLVDMLVTKVWGPDYNPKIAEVEFASAPTALEQEVERAKEGKANIVEAKMGPTATALQKADRLVFAQPRLKSYDASQARPVVLISCSDSKHPGTHRAVDLYKGVLFDVLRKWMPENNRPDVYIISAKHGLVHANDMLENYEQPMTEERLEALLRKGINVQKFPADNFSEVFIAGSAPYRELGQVYAEQMRKAGFLAPDGKVWTSADGAGIGTQRGDLGAYLRGLEAKGTPETAALAKQLEDADARRRTTAAMRDVVSEDSRERERAEKGAKVAFSELLARKAMAPYQELDAAGKASYKAGFIAGFSGQAFPREAVKDGAMDEGYQFGKRHSRDLEQRHKMYDGAIDDLSDSDVHAVHKQMGLAGAKQSADWKRDAIKKEHPDDIEQGLASLEKAPPAAEPAEDIDDGADIPLAFYSEVMVQHRVYSDDGKESELMDVPADVALESVREDITSIEAMLKCMGVK